MRRLRENTMLNTEIGKTGEVIVEGHVIGRLDGFTFAPDAAEAGSDAKALQATAQKALAGEIDARAEKLAAAPDDQFVLTSDATIRWTGDAVARLVAADDALHPRIRIISDDRLTGAPREAVQTRLDLWLKTYIEKLLGPLFGLAKAEDITGIARGIAFQLIEALGVLERSKIAAEMKDLDQPSRATLRKYGVRFGAYHIYVPALLKPAARALASLLWAQKLDNVDLSALSGAQHLAGSGRTSFPIDKLLDRDAYRVLGYRQCGERAVRVDILERLADLIRPALAWREGSPSQKPAGAFDGRGFVVTQAMTSLTGSAGEDFASILRALGYRMERRPAPPKPAAIEATPVETAPLEVAAPEASSPEAALPESAATDTSGLQPVAAAETADTADITNDVPPTVEATAVSSATLGSNVAFSPASHEPEAAAVEANPIDVLPDPAASTENLTPETLASEAPPSEAPASETPVSEPPQVEASAEIATESAAVGDAAPAAAPAAGATVPDVAAAPEMVDVWRPGGRSEERRPRHDRGRHRHQGNQDRPQEGAQPVAATGEANDGARRERHGRGRRDRGNDFRKPRSDAPPVEAAVAPAAEAAPVREPRDDKGRPSRERFADKGRDRDKDRDKGKFGGGRDKGGRDKGGRDKRDGGPSHRQFATSAPPRERERPVDPNSPFAKLAALKEQLTANRKDR
jgi:ATP-dependent RNA helicase SUPV3L1/SUV3